MKKFYLNIIIPSVISVLLFVLTIFLYIIPHYQDNIMNGKREMIKELNNAVQSLLFEYNKSVNEGTLTLEDAQKRAVYRMKNLRYGLENKDYFWITDLHPKMVMHPFRPDLDSTDLSDFKDHHGKKLFTEMVNIVKQSKEGYLDYSWQWKDDSLKMGSKLSYVKFFEPWGWIIGTGMYVEDVEIEIQKLTRNLILISIVITLLISFLLIYVSQQSLKIEKKRQTVVFALKEQNEEYAALNEEFKLKNEDLFEAKLLAEKKAREIEESESRYRFISENTSDVIWCIDLKTLKYTFVSSSVKNLLGYTPEDLIGKSLNYTLSKQSAELIEEIYQREILNRKHKDTSNNKFTNIIDQIHKNGNSVLTEIATKIVFDEDSNPFEIIGVSRDITERYQLEIEKTRLSNIIKYSLNEIFILKLPNLKFSYANQSALKNLGYSLAEILHFSPIDITNNFPENRMKWISDEFILIEKKIITFETEHKRKDGSIYPVEIHLQLFVENNEKMLFAFVNDISKRKEVENNLKESESKFRNIFNSSSDGILILDVNYEILNANETLLNLLNYELQEVRNKHIYDFVLPLYVEKLEERAKLLKNNISIESIEIEVVKKNGELLPVEINSKVIVYENSNAILVIVHNIFERKMLDKRIFNSIIYTEEKERERFAKDIHDGLGPLLSTCKIYLHTLKDKVSSDTEVHQYANRAEQLLDDSLLSIKEISNNLSPHILRNYGLIQAIKSFIDNLIPVTKVHFNFEYNSENRLNEIVEFTLYRIVTELINNTLKHAEASLVSISIKNKESNFELSYVDNGNGFDSEKLLSHKNGYGLINMENRIKKLDGILKFSTSLGKGVKVEIFLNLNTNQHD